MLDSVILPSARKIRGRPKGICQTVIGLPRKAGAKKGLKPIPFMKRTSLEKEKSKLVIMVRHAANLKAVLVTYTIY